MNEMRYCIRINIVSSDGDYAAALANAIAATQSGFAVTITDTEGLTDENTVYLMVRDDIDSGEQRAHGVISVRVGEHEFSVINMYAGCAAICNEVKLAYAALVGVARPAAGISLCAQIISVVGIDGGAGASSIAIGLADELSGYREKKALYISMEQFEALSLGYQNTGSESPRRDISDYLFHLFSGNGVLPAAPYILRNEFGAMRFEPAMSRNRLCELSEKDFANFMDALLPELNPDFVVIDWGSNPVDFARPYISGSELVLFVSRHGSAKATCSRLCAAAENFGADMAHALSIANRVPVNEDMPCESVGEDDSTQDGKGYEPLRALFAKDESPAHVSDIEMLNPSVNTADMDEMSIYEDHGGFDTSGGYTRVCLTNTFGTGIKAIADKLMGVFEIGQKGDRIYSAGYKDRLHSAYENEDEDEGGIDVAL